MKVLLTSDLHACASWYGWLLDRAPEVDLIAIAGDLVEGWHIGPNGTGIGVAKRILSKIVESGCPVAVCSGNHEMQLNADLRISQRVSLISRLRDLLAEIKDDSQDHPLFIGDRRSSLISSGEERLVLTALPYRIEGAYAPGAYLPFWEEGHALKQETGAKWLVLHHEPPKGGRVGGKFGNFRLIKEIQRYQPDFLASGHIHTIPYQPNGHYVDQFGKTLCFNAGQVPPDSSSIPNHIILETSTGESQWNTFHQSVN
jgi:Icc-related predicted phosphoesterase